MNNPKVEPGMNILRFYMDDDDQIIKCDYIENYDRTKYSEIKLSQKTLYDVLKKYMNNPRIYHQEVIKEKYIIYKFYDVDVDEIDALIELSNNVRDAITNPKFKKVEEPKVEEKAQKPTNNRPRVTRENKFQKKVVKASAITIAVLLSLGIGAAVIHNVNEKKAQQNSDTVITIPIDVYEKYMQDEKNKETTESPTTEEPQTESQTDVEQVIRIDTSDYTNEQKYINCKNQYYDLITKYANMYGIDPKLALAIACQERGVHSKEVDEKGGLGLFQIQVEGDWRWDGKDITAYNFATNEYETYTIYKDEVRDVDKNIKAGMMIFQDALRRNKYDIAKALQEYNFGPEGIKDAVNTCCEQEGFDKSYFADPNNLEWINYRKKTYGDPIYLENVLRYLNSGTVLVFKTPNGEQLTVLFTTEKELTMN